MIYVILDRPSVDLANVARRIVPPIAVGIGSAEDLSAKERASWKFENVIVPHTLVTRIPQSNTKSDWLR